MNMSGSIILIIAIGTIVLLSLSAADGLQKEANITIDNPAYNDYTMASKTTGTVYQVFGYIILGVGAFVGLKAFGVM